MLRKHLLLASACCAGLALAATGAQAQKAAAGAALIQPKGGWAVTKIDDANIPGGAYCTLARQYNNGVIFSIGRNQAEEYSLAVDFQEAKLDPDKGYKVALKAGTNQTRQLEIMPASPRAMVIRLGWDDSFFDALEKSGTFSITLDKDTYAFAVTEYAKGKADMANCMNTLKAAAGKGGTDVLNAESGTGSEGFSATKIAEGSVPKDAPPAPSKKPEKTIISSLDSKEVPGLAANDKAAFVPPTRSVDIATLEQENEKLRRTLDEQRRSYEAQLAQNNQGNELAELREKLRIAEAKSIAPAKGTAPVATPVVKEVVREVPTADPTQTQKIFQLEQEVSKLTAEKASLAKSVQDRTSIKPMTTPLPNPEQAQRIAALQKETEDLKAQLASAKKTPAPVAAASTQRPEDVAKIAELEKANTAYAQRITELQGEVGRWQQASVEQSKAAVAAKPAEDAKAKDELAALKASVQQKDQQIAALQVEAQKAIAAKPIISTAPAEDPKLQAEIASLKASLQQKDQEIAMLKAAPVAAKAPDNTATLTAELDALKTALQQRNQEIADLQTKVAVTEQVQVPRPPVATPAEPKEVLEKQVAMMKNDIEKKEGMIRSAQNRSGAQDNEIAGLKKQLAQVRRDNNTAVPDKRLQQENNSLKNQMARQQDAYRETIAVVQQKAEATSVSGIPPILGGAGIAASPDAARPANVVDAYQWKSGAITGRAQAMEGAGNALDVSQAYANMQRNACSGDFASVPGGASSDGRVTLDIACVDASGGKTQSLLFAQQGGQVLAFILEAPAVDMDQAMDARDQISRTF